MSDDGMRGPYAIAQDCRAKIIELDAEILAAPSKREAKALRRRRKLCRDMERWCKTRAGYVIPRKEKA